MKSEETETVKEETKSANKYKSLFSQPDIQPEKEEDLEESPD